MLQSGIMVSARMHVALGLLAIAALSSMLLRVRAARTLPAEPASTSPGIVSGLSTTAQDDVDHLVESYVAPPGLKSLQAQLEALEVTLHPEDRWTAIPDPTLGIGSTIEIVRATPVTVVDGGEERQFRTWSATIGELLAEQGIELDGDDRLSHEPQTPLAQNLEVTITRIGVHEETETEAIDYRTLTRSDPNLEKGSARVGQVGKNGTRTKTFQVTYENGAQVSRELVANEVTTEPVDEIVYEGTKVVTYGTGEATWYAWKPGGAAHNTLPFGTKVRVVNLTNGKSVDVVINDRGIQGSAIIDLDKASFVQLAPLGAGRIDVRLEKDYD